MPRLYLASGHEALTDTTISGGNVFLTAQDGSIINNDTLNTYFVQGGRRATA
ncbi:MAG: hypothetical protein ABF882_14730 [Acetobacter orientalis]